MCVCERVCLCVKVTHKGNENQIDRVYDSVFKVYWEKFCLHLEDTSLFLKADSWFLVVRADSWFLVVRADSCFLVVRAAGTGSVRSH